MCSYEESLKIHVCTTRITSASLFVRLFCTFISKNVCRCTRWYWLALVILKFPYFLASLAHSSHQRLEHRRESTKEKNQINETSLIEVFPIISNLQLFVYTLTLTACKIFFCSLQAKIREKRGTMFLRFRKMANMKICQCAWV